MIRKRRLHLPWRPGPDHEMGIICRFDGSGLDKAEKPSEVTCGLCKQYAIYGMALRQEERGTHGARVEDMNDPTNPRHYRTHPSGVECIQITEHFNFNLGNVIKYVWRHLHRNSGKIQDIEKAKWYLEREIKRIRKENTKRILAAGEIPITPARAGEVTDRVCGKCKSTFPRSDFPVYMIEPWEPNENKTICGECLKKRDK